MPTITATPERSDLGRPRVRLDIAGASGSTVDVTRYDADGTSTLVREAARVASGSGSAYDYEAPFGTPVRYRLTATGEESGTVVLDVSEVWLIHVFRPTASVRLDEVDVAHVATDALRRWSSPTSRQIVRPYGPRLPIVVSSGGRRARSSTLTCVTETREAAEALAALIADDTPVLLNVPVAWAPRVVTSYVSLGDVDVDYLDDDEVDPLVEWTLPLDVVGAPYGQIQPEWTWEDLEARFATMEDADAAFATWEDQETNLPIAAAS